MKNRKKWYSLIGAILIICVSVLFPTEEVLADASYWPEGIDVVSQAAIVMEASTGTILYEKNTEEAHYPASITKIMTAYVALKYGNMDDVVTFSADAINNTEGSGIARDIGEEMTLEQCMYGMLLESANECAYAIAEHVGGTVEHFVELMNEEAEALGCVNTHFSNPHGLPDETHYTCAYDMALIAQAAWQNETFRIMTGTTRYEIPPTNKHDEITYLNNHNRMLSSYKGTEYLYEYCVGGKTGYTEVAKSTLVTYAEKDGMTLICVVMYTDDPNQWTDSINLYDYCFANFQLYSVSSNEAEQLTSGSSLGIFNTYSSFVEFEENAQIVLPVAASFSDAVSELELESDDDDVIGVVRYTYAGHQVGEVNLIQSDAEVDGYEFESVITDRNTTENSTRVFQITPQNFAIAILILLGVLSLIFFIVRFYQNFYLFRQRYYARKNAKSPYKKIKKTKWKRRR